MLTPEHKQAWNSAVFEAWKANPSDPLVSIPAVVACAVAKHMAHLLVEHEAAVAWNTWLDGLKEGKPPANTQDWVTLCAENDRLIDAWKAAVSAAMPSAFGEKEG